ncbi:Eisosome protein 1 [Frankliniella fusca]|uniref:Eisosome protein 1 n=1 Tax=Frankliniella fusca TaxID=407009 RepID=A0AAE1HYC6_9NEOP|nr:Eisosome protein 1 [Frankliniella fusca]
MSIELLVALMRVRMGLKWGQGECCVGFRPPEEMLQLFTADMYETTAATGGNADPQIDAEDLGDAVRVLALEDGYEYFDFE